MDNITHLSQIDFKQLFIWIIMLLVAAKFLIELFGGTIGKLLNKLDIETKSMREKREQRELLTTTAQLAKTTAENLDKLQKRHTKDEENFRNNLNNYMEESRKDRKALHDEMKQFSNNRIGDRQVSIERERRLDDRITESNEHRDKIINGISETLSKLTDMMVDSNIENMRWEILNFCSALTSGRKYNKESFNHVISVHEKYEKIIEEHNMENGQVTASMEVIMDVYKEKLKNGF